MITPRTMIVAAACMAVFYGACNSTSVGPNDLGGDTNLDLTAVGGVFNAYLNTDTYNPAFSGMKDSIVITKNDNGIVTTHARIGFDSSFVAALDTLMGTASLPWSAKLAVLDVYLERFGATLDTTNKEAMTLTFDLKMKVTSDGIQEFVSSRGDLSRPYTIVKYDAAVGDTYEFTDVDGRKLKRTVTYKSTTDDYPVGFWLLKIIKVEENGDDAAVDKITYYANHKYGLVGAEITAKNGKVLKIGIVPPTL